MKRWIVAGWWLASGLVALGDGMVLANGQTVKGTFGGFQDHRFTFKSENGREYREFASAIRAIEVDSPSKVSVQCVTDQMENVLFTGYSQFTVRLLREKDEVRVPATMVKLMAIGGGPLPSAATSAAPAAVAGPREEPPSGEVPLPRAAVDAGTGDAVTEAAPAPAVREWERKGKWREIDTPDAQVISHGEEVDLGQALRKGVVNVVHFHIGSVHSSVRQGNYLETLAQKSKGKFVVKRVVTDWNSPICKALEIKSLPQFWFYSRTGRLTGKLIDRFTEADIDAAMKEASRAN